MRSRIRSNRFALVSLALLIALLPAVASAQAIIKVNDNVNFRLGILLQGWADWNGQSDAAGDTAGFQQNLFLRRARFFLGGQVAKDVTFFFMTDNPNLGKSTQTVARRHGRQGAGHRLHRPGRVPRVGDRERVPAQGRPHPDSALPQLQLERREPRHDGLRHLVVPGERLDAVLGRTRHGVPGEGLPRGRPPRVPRRRLLRLPRPRREERVPVHGPPPVQRVRRREGPVLPGHVPRQEEDPRDRRELRRAERLHARMPATSSSTVPSERTASRRRSTTSITTAAHLRLDAPAPRRPRSSSRTTSTPRRASSSGR